MPIAVGETFGSALEAMDNYERLVTDVETTGLGMWHGDRVCGVAVATPDLKHKYYFPLRHAEGPNLTKRQRSILSSWLSRDVKHSGWNFKFDMHMLAHDGVDIRDENAEDVMLALHLCNENEPNFRLKDSAAKYLGIGAVTEQKTLEQELRDRGLGKGGMWQLPAELVAPYALKDVILTEKMRRLCRKGLKDWGILKLWSEVNRYMCVTRRMESRGFLIDQDLILQYRDEADAMIGPARELMHRMAGYPINPNSPKQTQAWLGVPTTARDYLEDILSIQPDRKDIQALLDYRGWAKVNGSYYNAYLTKMDSNGVLHPNIKLHGTVSGRPSAEDPNLQAVPRYSQVYKVKDVLRARPGFTLISADYAQAEVRFGAKVCAEDTLLAILRSGADIHGSVATDLDIPRDAAKRIVFGIFYGLGAPGLAKRLKISQKLAEKYLKAFHSKYPKIRTHYYEMQRIAERAGYIRLWSGRVRRYNTKFAEPRKAMSNEVQGGVAEIMRYALTMLDQEIQTSYPESGIMLQVHDQIIVETPTAQARKMVRLMNEIMVKPFPEFEMRVDFKTSDVSWGAMKDYTLKKKVA